VDGKLTSLKITSTLSELEDPFGRALAEYLTSEMGAPVEFVDAPWQVRRRGFLSQKIAAAWICGGEYVRWSDRFDLEPLAAPVMAGTAYDRSPVYFSYIVVRDADADRFAGSLQGARIVINEEGSFSGDTALADHLRKTGAGVEVFHPRLISGSHTRSLEMVLEGSADAAAVDSMVYDLLSPRRSGLQRDLRILARLGPFPAPAWITHRGFPPARKQSLKAVLLQLHARPEGRAVLAHAGLSHFVPVTDAHFQPLRSYYKVGGM
jgi:ABC-type phosphate/phosphonate transport system substrate-binding protein